MIRIYCFCRSQVTDNTKRVGRKAWEEQPSNKPASILTIK